MSMVAEKKNNINSECICGGNMISKKDTLVRNIRGTEIKLHGLKFNECPDCGEVSFSIKDKVAERVVEAYKNGLKDIIF